MAWLLVILAFLPLVVLLILVLQKPVVPVELEQWPSLAFVYLQLIRSALSKKQFGKKGSAIEIKLTKPVPINAKKYSQYLKISGFKDIPPQVALNYPFIEVFRLAMLAMSHPDFPFPVLGAILSRNETRCIRPMSLEDKLTYSAIVDPDYIVNDKGHYEIGVTMKACTSIGQEVWVSTLTVLVLGKKKKTAGEAKPAAAPQPSAPQPQQQLDVWKLPGDTGRQFGAMTGDRNPIHLFPFTSQLFGFKRPIAHALCLVGKMEGSLANAGYLPAFPCKYATEFKRPTLLPAKLQAVLFGDATPGKPLPPGGLKVAILTEDGKKEVITGAFGAST